MSKNISIIVAVDSKNGIGLNNDMLIYISNDLKRFKSLTQNHTVIMGRKTWDSLPKKPLPKRTNIVITTQKNIKLEGAVVVNSIDEALSKCANEDEVFVMGGANIYKQILPIANKIYLTQIHRTFISDVFFPEINLDYWRVDDRLDVLDDKQAGVDYSFINLTKID